MRASRPALPTAVAANVQSRDVWPLCNGSDPCHAPDRRPAVLATAAPRGRSVIVTGACRGLGAALVAGLFPRGDRLLALGGRFTPEQHRAAAARPGTLLRHTDMADPATLPTTAELREFLDGAGGIEPGEAVLVHAAAAALPAAPHGGRDPSTMTAAIHANLLAPMRLTNRFLFGAPVRLHRLRVVYLTDGTARQPSPRRAVHCATSVAAEMFMRCVQGATNPRWTVDIVDAAAVARLVAYPGMVAADPHALAAGLLARLFGDRV